MKTILKRARAETPSFFKKLRNIAATSAAIAGSLLAAPIVLPAAITTAAGYIVAAGSVAGIVSQLTVKNVRKLKNQNPKNGGGYGKRFQL